MLKNTFKYIFMAFELIRNGVTNMKKTLKVAYTGILAAALLVGCSEEETKSVEQTNNSAVEAEVEEVVAEETVVEETVKEEAEINTTTDDVKQSSIEAGTVFGTLDTMKLKKTSDSMYLDEERDVMYLMAGEEVFQVEVNFDPALGLNVELDKAHLTNHAMDYMAADASLVQTVSEKEFVYESASLGKKYTVVFSGEEAVTRVIVSQNI